MGSGTNPWRDRSAQRIRRTEPKVPLYIVYFDADEDSEVRNEAPAGALKSFRLQPGMHLVHSELTQSRLYHKIKRKLSADAALFVGAMSEAPKFKKMDAGALKWVRSL
jgi:hypothetical protein